MLNRRNVLFDGTTDHARYQIIDMRYEGRDARVLFVGEQDAAHSGIARDDNHELLFDYIQRFFEVVLQVRPQHLLLIGGGAFTLPMALLHALPDIRIDVVEIDPILPELAAEYFGLQPSKRLHIIEGDGVKFLKESNHQYDMIILDVFEGVIIPPSFQTPAVADDIIRLLTSEGIFAMNVISAFPGHLGSPIRTHYRLHQQCYSSLSVYRAGVEIELRVPQNLILIGRRKDAPQFSMRYAELDTSMMSLDNR